ncbi:hypothetical protein DSECCO2_468450 [anaerobic digester metagenome]
MKRIKMRFIAVLIAVVCFVTAFSTTAYAANPKAGDYVDPVEYYDLAQFAGYQLTAQSDIRDAIFAKDLLPVELVLKPLYIETSAIRLAHGNSGDLSPLADYMVYQGESLVIKCNEKNSYTIVYETGNSGTEGNHDGAYNFQWQANVDIAFNDIYFHIVDNDWTGKSVKLDYKSSGTATSSASQRYPKPEKNRNGTYTFQYTFEDNKENEGIRWFVDDTGILKLWVDTMTTPDGIFEEWHWENPDEISRDSLSQATATVFFQVEQVKLGKIDSASAGASGLVDTRSDREDGDNDHADPLTTLAISILGILLSILFGNTGGFIPTVPAGTGGAPTLAPAGSGLSRWLHFDGDGDIETTDPVNGQRRTFVQNGDGTYTDPVSGATYTPEELSEQLEHRADNAGTIGQDEAQFRQNVSEDSQRNQERSEESRQLEEDLQREREERSRKEKIERIATDLGMSGASEKEVRVELERRLERDEEYRQKMHDYAQRRDTAVDILEATVDIADYTMAAGEAVVPGGKTVSATYKGIKNTVSTMAEKGASWGSFTEGVIKGGTEAATTVMDAGIGKAATAFGGTVAGEVAEAVNDGSDLTEALAAGAVKGTLNAASGAVGDAYGDMVGGTDALNKAAETAGKLGEVGFEKNVTGNTDDFLHRKDK